MASLALANVSNVVTSSDACNIFFLNGQENVNMMGRINGNNDSRLRNEVFIIWEKA